MKKKFRLFKLIIVFSVLFSCAGHEKEVAIIGTWGGNELDNFLKVCESSQVKVKFETTRDLDALITTRIAAGNLPDIAILPNPAKMQDLVKQGRIKRLDFLDKKELAGSYSKIWLDMASYAGGLYGIFYKATNKSVIWYNPQEFKKNGWSVPKTWDELVELTNRIRKEGKTPWSIGADIGWPLTDWIENIVVRSAGPEIYSQWIDHRIPWTDPAIKNAFNEWKKIVGDPANLEGGIDGTLAASFQNAAYEVFLKKPGAYMYFEGDFIEDIVKKELPYIEPGVNMAFFPFPPINKKFGNPVVGGADLIVVFRLTPDVEKLMKFLVTSKAHEIWVKSGGFISQNKNVRFDSYPDSISRSLAEELVNANDFVFDASDMMPSAVGNQGGFWDACKRFVQNPGDLDAILDGMEKLAEKNY